MSRPLSARELPGRFDPEAVFVHVFAAEPHVFWLDAGPQADHGWSWMGAGEPETDPAAVRRVSATPAESPPHEPAPHAAPGPFPGGWVGWSGYDPAAARAGSPHLDDPGVPAEVWLRTSGFLAFDHSRRRTWAVAPEDHLDALVARVARVIAAPPTVEPAAARPAATTARHTPAEYAALIERCRDAIRAGDAYQLCLTTRFSVPGGHDPIDVYRRLRRITPAHHGGLIVSAGAALVSASPERFLEIGDGIVRTHPIKGTRPRGSDAATDAALAEELRASPKERAENVMIVDLMRNDLSRVCDDGSVTVERLLEVESYPAVHQLVSTVSGVLRSEATMGDVIDATFPAGSMTGAPKLSAMSILHRLEDAPRGVFSGCFGWIADSGRADLAMVIRSIVIGVGGAYVGAGGGITWGSDAAAEVAEVGVKARGPLASLGASLPSGW